MDKYRIRTGETFVLASGERKNGGDIIELEDDVAAVHSTRVERVIDNPQASETESDT